MQLNLLTSPESLSAGELITVPRAEFEALRQFYEAWMAGSVASTVAAFSEAMAAQNVAREALSLITQPAKRNAIVRLSTVLTSAVADGVLTRNPAEAIELPHRTRKEVDPFTQVEADQIIAAMYARDHWPTSIYAALYEFMFYSGLRIAEALALQWDAVDLERKHVRVFRVVALGEVEERTKTHKARTVLLNQRAIHALEFAKAYAERRKNGQGKIKETPFVFPPSKNAEHVKQTSDIHHQWRPTLKALGIRYRRPYNCRHTYATMCLMSGMNPAFIAQQLGNTVQMLLSTYARWINSGSDWSEIAKLEMGIKLVSA